MELWVQAKDFPGYEVSSEGRIRNSKTGRILKTFPNPKGYEQLTLRRDKQQLTRPVHRLVADSFYDGEHEGLDVNHIDGNKKNNRVVNLEWCTRKENTIHAFKNGLAKSARSMKVKCIETGEVFNSMRECAKALGFSQTMMTDYFNGEITHCKGYHFEKITN